MSTADAIDVLMSEHRRIEGLLDALDTYATRASSGLGPPRQDLADLVAVLRGYADAHHHAKEEDVLFRAMADAGVPADDGPVAMMFEQHREGRRLVAELAELSYGSDPMTEANGRDIARVSQDYSDMLRAHIRAEDDMVYPLARERILPNAWDDVITQCAELDVERSKDVGELLERAALLCARYRHAT